MNYEQRTPVENPYCPRQFATDEPIEQLYDWWPRRGICPACGKGVNLRKNGTAKLHRVYGRGAMARRIAEWRRTGQLS